ncbi:MULTISPECIES: branched-chain amino acid aminotransferase [unclassified Roseivivax]|uniref:branched-chain amino acid aminotransferase n=1 Tax=Roseivivax sp. GX 12232 TaxID=2900547 RepID=UPI001E471237|nr:branched-chain amino acid aminotransferase [Roseivivax sp. GX 12232]MCE0505756.1 branched-chain amino acid aminotransferase [Roseivivax sp. GX 12232]
MATGRNIRTYFNGTWQQGDVAVMRAADHGAWLGSTVFDGARFVDGMAPDLDKHCARINHSARALMIEPTHSDAEILEIAREGLKAFPREAQVYIRPMYWSLNSEPSAIMPKIGKAETGFALCLEEFPMLGRDETVTLGRTRFRRPVLEDNVVNAKAGCLYPNNSRMLAEVNARGFTNALVGDAMGNVAETATSNVFMVKDGVVFTPIPNGTFLSGITRARHIENLRADGVEVVETVLSFADFEAADEVFLTGNLNKVTPVSAFEDVQYEFGPVTRRARDIYWDWAASAGV